MQPVTTIGCVSYSEGWGFFLLLFPCEPFPLLPRSVGGCPSPQGAWAPQHRPIPGPLCTPSPPSPLPAGSVPTAVRRGAGVHTCSTHTHTQAPAVVPAPLCPLPSAPGFVRPAVRPSIHQVLHVVRTRHGRQRAGICTKLFLKCFFCWLLLKKKKKATPQNAAPPARPACATPNFVIRRRCPASSPSAGGLRQLEGEQPWFPRTD